MTSKLKQTPSNRKKQTVSMRHRECGEISTVVVNYEASSEHELTVMAGQQVEILNKQSLSESPWRMVRLLEPSQSSAKNHGLIPTIILNPPPNKANVSPSLSCRSPRPNSADLTGLATDFRPRSLSGGQLLKKHSLGTGSGVFKKLFSGKSSLRRKHSSPDEQALDRLKASPEFKLKVEKVHSEGYIQQPNEPHELLVKSSSKSYYSMEKKPDSLPLFENRLGVDEELAGDGKSPMTPSASQDFEQTRVLSMEEKLEIELAASKTKRRYVMTELLETERDYVDDLSKIVNGYMEALRTMDLPADLNGKDKIVFGNVHQIFDFHRETFLPEIEKNVADAQGLGALFKRYERRFYMYVKYCENKPKSEFIVAEYLETVFNEVKKTLGHRLQLTDYLIKPVQRIMKYQLLLKDILKYTKRCGEPYDTLEDAIRVMHVVPKAANDMMNVGRLQGFDGNITAQGKLLHQDTLLVAENNPSKPELKYKERRVFLFEQIIIFSEVIESKSSMVAPHYVFKSCIKVNKMSLENWLEDSLAFMLVDKHSGTELVLQTRSEAQKSLWTNQIRDMLDMQGNFLRALQSPIAYHREGVTIGSEAGELDFPSTGSLPDHRGSLLLDTNTNTVQRRKSGFFDSLKRDKKNKVNSLNGTSHSVSIT